MNWINEEGELAFFSGGWKEIFFKGFFYFAAENINFVDKKGCNRKICDFWFELNLFANGNFSCIFADFNHRCGLIFGVIYGLWR